MKFDFDKSLNNFAIEWYEDHKDMLTPDEMEEVVDELFDEWAETVLPELGVTPREYFAELSSDELFEAYVDYLNANALPTVLLDEISTRVELGDKLIKLLRESENNAVIETTMEVLEEHGNKGVYATYVEWVLDEGTDDDIALHACEIMQDDADRIRDDLLKAIPTASEKVKDRICDLIAYATPCEQGYSLLADKFVRGVDLPLYAAYLGKYGDVRAIPLLKEAAQTCDYPAYMEIRNAVSMLGEELDEERDFTQDPVYRMIKGLPKLKEKKPEQPTQEDKQ